MPKFVMLLTKSGEPWKEDKRFDLYLNHTPNPGEMIFFENNVYQILALRNDCVRKNNDLVADKCYCFVQLIKKDVQSMEQDLYQKLDKAMDDYKKLREAYHIG